MKIRNGFVSNSSSASFVVPKNALNEVQIDFAINLFEVLDKLGISHFKEDWSAAHVGNEIEFNGTDHSDPSYILNIVGIYASGMFRDDG